MGMITKTKEGRMKRRLILDCKESGSTSEQQKAENESYLGSAMPSMTQSIS